MIPYIDLYFGEVSSFVVFSVLGVLALIISTELLIKASRDRRTEENYIFPKIVCSGMVGLLFAALFDAGFKIARNHAFIIKGISFYGGLIGASVCLLVLLKLFRNNTQYSAKEWFDILTRPMLLFHFFGRLGCFFAGCCYGKTTSSCLGVAFPDNAAAGIFHHGQTCYPTQLFEAFALLVIFAVVCFVSEKFYVYILLYASARFVIEFFRGDDRGCFIGIFSPAQVISVCLFAASLLHLCFIRLNGRKKLREMTD